MYYIYSCFIVLGYEKLKSSTINRKNLLLLFGSLFLILTSMCPSVYAFTPRHEYKLIPINETPYIIISTDITIFPEGTHLKIINYSTINPSFLSARLIGGYDNNSREWLENVSVKNNTMLITRPFREIYILTGNMTIYHGFQSISKSSPYPVIAALSIVAAVFFESLFEHWPYVIIGFFAIILAIVLLLVYKKNRKMPPHLILLFGLIALPFSPSVFALQASAPSNKVMQATVNANPTGNLSDLFVPFNFSFTPGISGSGKTITANATIVG